jgi:transcriptional regulator with XRE-family HTH domain
LKKYTLLGELLVDYRKLNNISQAGFAAKMNVDIRTVIRWEANETLIKSEKEEELVEETFIPYQVIRNLNAMVAIPTYYDFRIRKYALAELSNKMPDAHWFKVQMNHTTKRMRRIAFDSDVDNILKYTQFEYKQAKPVSRELIKEALKRLPELNLIIFDHAGYYSGHSVILPINQTTFQKLKNREIVEGQLTENDLVDFRKEPVPVFHAFDLTADCNENMYYLIGTILRFFQEISHKNYLYSSITARYDSYEINEQIGMKIVWEDRQEQADLSLPAPPRFYEGNFEAFLEA